MISGGAPLISGASPVMAAPVVTAGSVMAPVAGSVTAPVTGSVSAPVVTRSVAAPAMPVHNPYMIQGSYPLMPQSSFGMTGGSFVAPPAPVYSSAPVTMAAPMTVRSSVAAPVAGSIAAPSLTGTTGTLSYPTTFSSTYGGHALAPSYGAPVSYGTYGGSYGTAGTVTYGARYPGTAATYAGADATAE
jgi:hypothetical protein